MESDENLPTSGMDSNVEGVSESATSKMSENQGNIFYKRWLNTLISNFLPTIKSMEKSIVFLKLQAPSRLSNFKIVS